MSTAYSSPSNTSVGSYPVPNVALAVSNVAGLPTGAASGDSCTRQADMSIWDTANAVFVNPGQSNAPRPNV